MNTNYQSALSFISGYGWNDDKLRKADGIITLVATMLELYKKPSDTEIIRLQNVGIEMANMIEQQRKEIISLKEQLAIASEQVPKGAFIFNNELIQKK